MRSWAAGGVLEMLQRVGFDVYGHAQRATGWMLVQNVDDRYPDPLPPPSNQPPNPTHPSASGCRRIPNPEAEEPPGE